MEKNSKKNTYGVLSGYRRRTKNKLIFLLVLLLAAVFAAALCITAGISGFGFFDVIKALFGKGDETAVLIVKNIRLPRTAAAVIAGAGLSLSGCIMQNVLKNPMASPSTLGVSNAAVFGANFAITVLGAGAFHSTHGETLTISSTYTVTLCAFAFAAGAAVLILVLSGKRGFSSETVVLAGIGVGALFSAGTTVIQYFSMDTQVASAVYWSFGDLGRASDKENIIMLAAVVASGVYFYIKRWDYNALANGDEVAKSLGVKTSQLRFISLMAASLLCAVCVSFLGIIGFLGIMAPTLVKRFTGGDYRYMLPASALAGAAILLLADTAARSLLSGVSLPVGAVTSLLGGPVFLHMLLKKRKGGEVRC